MPDGAERLRAFLSGDITEALDIMIASECCVLEVLEEPVGILVRETGGLVFHAAAGPAWAANGRVFQTVSSAKREVLHLMGRLGPSLRPASARRARKKVS